MELKDILKGGSIEESAAFLQSYIPIAFSDIQFDKNTSQTKNYDEFIVKGPEEYIDPACVSASNELLKKNIYVLDSKKMNGDMYLILDSLSPENMEIFKAKYREYPDNYCSNFGPKKNLAIRVSNYLKERNLEGYFKQLVDGFQIQDIQRGFLTEKTFLMCVCDCEKVEGLKEYKKQDLQVVFDVEKMDKSFKDYLKDSGYEDYYVPEEHRIYMNEYYYNAHQNYINSQNT